MNTLDFKEGQTYICTKANERWLTEGKEYEVGLSSLNKTFIVDDDGDRWTSNDLSVSDSTFKLKEKTFDLNGLTIEQLKEYIGLLENKENAERLLNDFIERMSK